MIAISVKENNKKSILEMCFGKSEYFFLYDQVKNRSSFVINPGKMVKKNSGKKAASFLVKTGVKTVFSSNFGVPVKKIFDKNKVQMVILSDKFKSLDEIHWIK
jgi:predicted Fe-Mo cluster-binding NifX family protein